jgi:hypothetical protein
MSKRKHSPGSAFTYTLWHELMASTIEPMPLAKRTHQITRMLQGLASIEQCAAPTTEDWRLCSDAVNLMETLVLQLRVAEDRQGLLNDAIAALAAAGRRHKGGMPIRLDGPGIQAVRAVLEDYAELLAILPARTVIRAHRLTERRIAAILAGKRRPHDVEVMDL